MRIRRLAVAAVAVAALAGFTGCASPAESPSADAGKGSAAAPASSAPADAGAELAAAGGKLADTSVKVDMTAVGGITMTGMVDPTSQKAEMTTDMGSVGKMTMRQVGGDLYVQTKGQIASATGAPAGKWMHVDLTKVPETSALNIKNYDPRVTAKLLTANSAVTRTGEHGFTGKLDLTKSSTLNPAALKSLGLKATAVPFTAKTDSAGRLTELILELDALAPGAGKMTTKYSAFGAPVTVTPPPAAQVIEMPEKYRKAMGA